MYYFDRLNYSKIIYYKLKYTYKFIEEIYVQQIERADLYNLKINTTKQRRFLLKPNMHVQEKVERIITVITSYYITQENWKMTQKCSYIILITFTVTDYQSSWVETQTSASYNYSFLNFRLTDLVFRGPRRIMPVTKKYHAKKM